MVFNTVPRPEHPNPQWERKNWKNLNGTWQFEIDYSCSGEERGLPVADCLSGSIMVPFCPESRLSGVEVKDFMNCVWYKKAIALTEDDLQGNRVLFHIGACDYETKVWVNGKSTGFSHKGGYTPIDLDITAFVHPGDNLITVAAYDDVRSFKQAVTTPTAATTPVPPASGRPFGMRSYPKATSNTPGSLPIWKTELFVSTLN